MGFVSYGHDRVLICVCEAFDDVGAGQVDLAGA